MSARPSVASKWRGVSPLGPIGIPWSVLKWPERSNLKKFSSSPSLTSWWSLSKSSCWLFRFCCMSMTYLNENYFLCSFYEINIFPTLITNSLMVLLEVFILMQYFSLFWKKLISSYWHCGELLYILLLFFTIILLSLFVFVGFLPTERKSFSLMIKLL